MPPKRRSDASAVENNPNLLNIERGLDEQLRIDLAKKETPASRNNESNAESLAKNKPQQKRKSESGGDLAVNDEEDYIPKWASSSNQTSTFNYSDNLPDIEDCETNDDVQLLSADELPSFSDEESKALHREIKLLEQRRDDAAKSARSHRERINVINDHLHSIRQEIEHTNSLVAAKKGEVDTEEHLLSLSQREFGQCSRDTSAVGDDITTKQKKIARCQNQLVSAEDELEKLKTDLNWNQEELEQWATAATKKEEENLLLQKYTLADELKIKELTLNIEDLTKIIVEKKSLLENEVTETRSNQTELEKLAERFKSRHGERRHLIQQWKDTIDSLNSRDQAIGTLATQYAELIDQEDKAKDVLALNKNQHEMLENERSDFEQDISYRERLLQAKRQDLSSLQVSEGLLKTETDSLQRENSASAASMDKKKSERKVALKWLEQKKEHAESLAKVLHDTKEKLSQDKLVTLSTEKITEAIEKALVAREKDLEAAEKNIAQLKQKMYKDSQRLAEFRKKEADLISDIHGAHANIKNFLSKVNELESKRSRQQELLYNATFQLQQMEKKVSRGLGERSNEEQQKLLARIEELEKDVVSEKQKKSLLIQQQRKLQAELRAWNKKYEQSDTKYNETMRKIDDVDLEIYACEQSLKETVLKREEAMVSHDVTLLDVPRLRDNLRSLLQEVYSLKQQDIQTLSYNQDKKDEVRRRIEINMSHLRTRKEERHKTAIDLGRLKMTLEKVQSKYDMVRSINSKEGEGYESPELKLILAAQKRQELQQEGDALDETIRTKEMEIRTMKNTLVQLQERNSNFRSSFSKADMNGVKAQELKTLECKVEESEDSLVRVRKELQVLQKCITEDRLKLDGLTQELTKCEEKSQVLARAKEKYESELERCNATLDGYNAKVVALQEICSQNSKSGQELQLKKFKAELVQIQSDRICKLLVHLGKEFPELRSDIMDELHKIGHET